MRPCFDTEFFKFTSRGRPKDAPFKHLLSHRLRYEIGVECGDIFVFRFLEGGCHVCEYLQVLDENGVKRHILDPEMIAHASPGIEIASAIRVNEFDAPIQMILVGNIRGDIERRIEPRTVVLAGFVRIDDTGEMITARIPFREEKFVVTVHRRVDLLQKRKIIRSAIRLPCGIRDHGRLGERTCPVDSPFVAMQVAGFPVNDVREHAIVKLFGEKRPELRLRRVGLTLA